MFQLKQRNRIWLTCYRFSLRSLGCRPAAHAGQPVIWETSGRAELLKGDARGVSISDTGVLMLAPQLTEVFNTEQAFVWSSAVDSQGNVYLGTGHDGKIYRVTADGRGSLLYDAAELDVTALAVGRDGALYAGTSPDGKVYRITADGRAEVYFDPADKYIWSLAVLQRRLAGGWHRRQRQALSRCAAPVRSRSRHF